MCGGSSSSAAMTSTPCRLANGSAPFSGTLLVCRITASGPNSSPIWRNASSIVAARNRLRCIAELHRSQDLHRDARSDLVVRQHGHLRQVSFDQAAQIRADPGSAEEDRLPRERQAFLYPFRNSFDYLLRKPGL